MRTSFFLLSGFIALRLASFASYFSAPEAINVSILSIISGIFIAIFLFLYKKNPLLGFFVLLTEIALGGAGHYLEFFGISLRTCLLILFLSLFFIFERKKIISSPLPKPLLISGGIFSTSLLLGVFLGFKNGHPSTFIIQDALPFLFLGLVFPFITYWKGIVTSTYTKSLLNVFIIGNALFSILTLGLFSFGVVHLQEPYYKWFRDVAMGKITDMGTGFFRIVLPEHLLMIPIALVLTALLIKNPHHKLIRYLQIATLLTITLNFSRMYFLALGAATLFLFVKKKVKTWLKESIIFGTIIFILFTGTHSIVSKGQSFGLELFSSRAKSVIDPHSEISGATRMTLLPEIVQKIKKSPVFGSGLGATVPFTDPTTGVHKETRQFDWGYFELWTEIGLIGLLSLLTFLIYPIFLYWKTKKSAYIPGLAATCLALLCITLTTPALFHVFGSFFMAFFLASHFHMQIK